MISSSRRGPFLGNVNLCDVFMLMFIGFLAGLCRVMVYRVVAALLLGFMVEDKNL